MTNAFMYMYMYRGVPDVMYEHSWLTQHLSRDVHVILLLNMKHIQWSHDFNMGSVASLHDGAGLAPE